MDRLGSMHEYQNALNRMNPFGNVNTSINTTGGSSSSESVGNIFGQIAVMGLGIGGSILMQNAQQKSESATADMSVRTTALTNKAKAEAMIKVFTPKLNEAKARLNAANKDNYESSKNELMRRLEDLNSKAGLKENLKLEKTTPDNVKALQQTRTQLTSMKSNAADYTKNVETMNSIKGNNTTSTLSGSKPSITISDNGATPNTFELKDFMRNTTEPSDEKEKAAWNSAKLEAEARVNSANQEAKSKADTYNTALNKNKSLESESKNVKDISGNGRTAKTPADAVAILEGNITFLENQKAQGGENSTASITAKEYETQKAEIMKDLNKLEADHNSTKSLQTTIDSYEAKISEQQGIIDSADATIALLDAKKQKASNLDNQIAQKKNYLKSTDTRKKFLGIKFGNNDKDTKAVRNQTKQEIQDLKNQRSELL